MAEPNYMLYAEYMGRRNPYADVADKIGGTIDQMKQADRQRAIDEQNARLRDIQIQQAQIGLQGSQREAAQQNELYQSLANAQPTTQFVPQGGGLYDMPSGIPSVMQTPTLDTSAPQTPSVFNTPGSIQTTQPDRLQIVLDHAMKYGALDQAKNAIDMQTLIRNSAPDKVAEREALQELGTFTAAMKNIKELQKSGLLTDSMLDGLYRMLPPKIQAYFPDGIQKDEVDTTTGDLLVKDPQTGEVIGRWVTSPDGEKTQFVKEDRKETWSEPYEISVGGKKAMVQKSSKGQIKPVLQDVSTTVKVSPASDFRMDDSNRKYAAALRKEFNNLPEIKESNSIMPKITSMHKALEESRRTNNFVAVDQALITLYNKLTDPSSVVRESEYARTAANIPLLNAIKGKAQKIMTGGAGLTQAERNALVQMADLMKRGYDDIRQNRVEEYHGYARTAGVDPQTVIDDSRRSGKGKGSSVKSGRFTVEEVK